MERGRKVANERAAAEEAARLEQVRVREAERAHERHMAQTVGVAFKCWPWQERAACQYALFVAYQFTSYLVCLSSRGGLGGQRADTAKFESDAAKAREVEAARRLEEQVRAVKVGCINHSMAAHHCRLYRVRVHTNLPESQRGASKGQCGPRRV